MKNNNWLLILLLFSWIFLITACATPVFDEKKWQLRTTNIDTKKLYAYNKNSETFYNPWLPSERKSFFRVLSWKFTKAANSYTKEEIAYKPKINILKAADLIKVQNRNYIIWIGHNTFLIKIENNYFITDPMFSKRALLPKRVTPPAITIAELKKVTKTINIIVSHNHYDHLDEDSIEELPNNGTTIVPLGLKELISDLNKDNIVELNWWQEHVFKNNFKIVCLPAQHWSRRITQSTNSTLWASFMLVTPKHTFYLGGDSGYFIGYKEFAKKFKKIDYAFLPITAYHPRWFMHYAHMNVEEAISAFDDLNAKYFIPTQWGTFNLGDNPPGYPGLDLKRNIKDQHLNKNRFLILEIGQILFLN
jgi:L-ascorbate metabolism protein UlaG (beta-lactamase superfamily)